MQDDDVSNEFYFPTPLEQLEKDAHRRFPTAPPDREGLILYLTERIYELHICYFFTTDGVEIRTITVELATTMLKRWGDYREL